MHIFKFLEYGVYLREVELPLNDPDFMVIKDPDGDKWRCNKIILRKRYNLNSVETFKLLIDNGADIHAGNERALKWSAKEGHLEMVKLLVENGANIHATYDYALRHSTKNGHLEIVKFLVERGANTSVMNNYVFIDSA